MEGNGFPASNAMAFEAFGEQELFDGGESPSNDLSSWFGSSSAGSEGESDFSQSGSSTSFSSCYEAGIVDLSQRAGNGDTSSSAGTSVTSPSPLATAKRQAAGFDLPGSDGCAYGRAETTPELVGRGFREKLENWEAFEQLLLDDTYVFQERPEVLELPFGIFRESPKKRRKAGQHMDKWINSGGLQGSISWPTTGPARARCKYGAVKCFDGRELRYYEYTLIANGNPGLSQDQLDRCLWQVCPRTRDVPRRSTRSDTSVAAVAHQEQKKSSTKKISPRQPQQPQPQMLDQRAAKRKREMPKRTLAAPVRIHDTRRSDALGARLLDLNFVGRAADHANELELQDLKYVSFVNEGEDVGSLSTSSAGLKLGTAAGDFAEWHELSDQTESLLEGDVVGICKGKVSRQTGRAAMVGVVTKKAAIVGSRRAWFSRTCTGAEIAYCGRVPVRVRGPVREGDVLVSSGRNDGSAMVISNSSVGDVNCDVGCAMEHRATQRPLQVGVALQTCDQAREDVSLVEIAVTGPSMSSSSIQQHNKRSGAAFTIRAVIFVTLFVALISSAAVWITIHHIAFGTTQEADLGEQSYGDFFGDDDLLPELNVLTELVCLSGMSNRPASLMHLPCYLFRPHSGLPGTVGVFQPVSASNCNPMLTRTGNQPGRAAEACWELQYGDFEAAYSEDKFYDKLQLARVPVLSAVPDFEPRIMAEDRGPFRCHDNQSPGYPNGSGCPAAHIRCTDLLESMDFSEAAVVCTSGQLSDLPFCADKFECPASLYEPGSTTPLDGAIYTRNVCPVSCANVVGPRGDHKNYRRSLDDTIGIIAENSSEQFSGDLNLFINPAVPQTDSPGAPSDLLHHGDAFSTWWIGGVLKPAAADGNLSHFVPPEFLGEAPWLCLEDVFVNTSRYGVRSTVKLGVSSFLADSCASHSIVCDPNAREELKKICSSLTDKPSSSDPVLLGICEPDSVLNLTSGHCEASRAAPYSEADSEQAEAYLVKAGLKRPWGTQVPGNGSDRADRIQDLVETVTFIFG